MNKKIVLVILVAFNLLFCTRTFSQTNPLDNIYTLPDNSFLNSSKSNTTNFDFPKNSFLIRTSELVRKEAIFQYERFLFNPVSLSVSLGFPFGDDFIEKHFSELALEFNDRNSYKTSIYNLYEISVLSSGFIWGTSIKIFPSFVGDERELFVELNMKNSIKNFHINELNYSSRDFQVKYNYFGLSLGSKMTTGNTKVKFTHEISLGLGMKNVKWEDYQWELYNSEEYYRKLSTIGRYSFGIIMIKYNLGLGF